LVYYYFNRERVEAIRIALGLPKVDEQSIKELFAGFVAEMDMASSYKPVMLLALLDNVDARSISRKDTECPSCLSARLFCPIRRQPEPIPLERNPFYRTVCPCRNWVSFDMAAGDGGKESRGTRFEREGS
jgi:hypothetical protein